MGKLRQALRADLQAEAADRRFGSGWISGVLALACALAGLITVLCIRYPNLLTTPMLREQLGVPVRDVADPTGQPLRDGGVRGIAPERGVRDPPALGGATSLLALCRPREAAVHDDRPPGRHHLVPERQRLRVRALAHLRRVESLPEAGGGPLT